MWRIAGVVRAKKMRQDGGAEFISASLKPQASAISSMEASVACRSRLDWRRQNRVDAMGVQRLPLHRVLPRREDVTKGALKRRYALPRIEKTMTLNEVLRIGGTANPCKVEPEEVPCLVTSIAVRLPAVDEEDFIRVSARRLSAVLSIEYTRPHEHEQA